MMTSSLAQWMAPESLMFRKFTHQSDVWSFGILACKSTAAQVDSNFCSHDLTLSRLSNFLNAVGEVFSYGATPYGQLTGPEVLVLLESGARLERPAECPAKDYEWLLKCWSKDAADRPNFARSSHYFTHAYANQPVRDIGQLLNGA